MIIGKRTECRRKSLQKSLTLCDRQFQTGNVETVRHVGFEYKSKTMIKGLPLIHINIGGFLPRRAKGIIAIGDIAKGAGTLTYF